MTTCSSGINMKGDLLRLNTVARFGQMAESLERLKALIGGSPKWASVKTPLYLRVDGRLLVQNSDAVPCQSIPHKAHAPKRNALSPFPPTVDCHIADP
jgi:hypothetical protein